jgi:ABC-2 type transport system permease protein
MSARSPRIAPLRALTSSRIRIMVREPETVFWVFFFPVLLALGLGVAFSSPGTDRYLVVIEAGEGAQALAEALGGQAGGDHGVEVRILPPDSADRELARGAADLILVPAEAEGSPTARFDPTRPEGRQARTAVGLALADAGAAAGGAPFPVPDDEPVAQPGRRYIDWLIPGLIGFNLMSTGLWAMGFYITQMRQNGQLKRLSATPMRRSDFLASQILARFGFLLVEVPLLALFAWAAFGVEIRGALASLGVVVLLGAACFSALGLLTATRARSIEAVSGIINVILLPMVILSGVFFSPSRFPEPVQPLIGALPLTALNEALRGVYTDGATLGSLGPELAIVAAWTAGAFVLALRLFRWQ